MNIIMSGALPNHHLFRGPPGASQQHRQISSASTPTSPQSPFDFIDRIPYNEVQVSNETLGSGSFGTVFKGRWRGRKVAVKQFKTREERDSFLVEVKQLSCVKHANIVTLYGAITLPDTAYLIMEYAEGGSLNHLLHESKEQDYDLRHACSWARQTARGVAYLHGIRPKPIMHRDLKPANLLLFSRGKILKICDFGTACDVKTQMTNNTGSPSYMAPEVFATSSYLESGDVFSWSIIFWETLVRTHPYSQPYSNPFQILWSVNQGTRPAVIEDCPKPIWNLITRSWNKDPRKRPSMDKIAQEMDFIYSLTDKRRLITVQDGSNRVSHSSKSDQKNQFNKPLTFRTASDAPSSPLPQTSSRQARPLHSSESSSIKLRNIARDNLTASDLFYEIRHQNITHIASTSSSQYQHHQYGAPSPKQHHLQYNEQTSNKKHYIQNRAFKVNHKLALQHHISSLQNSSKRLEDESICDKLDKDVSFDDFEKLKEQIKSLRRHITEINQQKQESQSRLVASRAGAHSEVDQLVQRQFLDTSGVRFQ